MPIFLFLFGFGGVVVVLMRSNEFISLESLHRRGFKPVSLRGKRAIMEQLFDGRDLHFNKNLVVFNAQQQYIAKLVKCEKNTKQLEVQIISSLEDLERLGYEPLNNDCESNLLIKFLEGKILFLSENGYVYDESIKEGELLVPSESRYVYNEKMKSVACVLPIIRGENY